MAEEAPAAAPAPAPAKPDKKKKTDKPKRSSPSVGQLICKIVVDAKDRKGTSSSAIKKGLNIGGYDADKHKGRVNAAIRKLVKDGTLIQVKGSGASGSFKIGKKSTETKTKADVKKTTAASKPKPRSSIPKKPAGAKKSKVTPKKAAPAKKTEKVKKSVTPKKAAKSPKPAKVSRTSKNTKKAAKKPPASKKPAAKKATKPTPRKGPSKKK